MIRRPFVEAVGVDPSVLSDLEHGTLIRVEQE